jgi:hypothetical protein
MPKRLYRETVGHDRSYLINSISNEETHNHIACIFCFPNRMPQYTKLLQCSRTALQAFARLEPKLTQLLQRPDELIINEQKVTRYKAEEIVKQFHYEMGLP